MIRLACVVAQGKQCSASKQSERYICVNCGIGVCVQRQGAWPDGQRERWVVIQQSTVRLSWVCLRHQTCASGTCLNFPVSHDYTRQISQQKFLFLSFHYHVHLGNDYNCHDPTTSFCVLGWINNWSINIISQKSLRHLRLVFKFTSGQYPLHNPRLS